MAGFSGGTMEALDKMLDLSSSLRDELTQIESMIREAKKILQKAELLIRHNENAKHCFTFNGRKFRIVEEEEGHSGFFD